MLIAGGAAADYTKALDVDVWFLKNTSNAAHKFCADQQLNLNSGNETYASGTVIRTYFDIELGKKVQVIVTNAETAEALLGFFDLSVHQWAVNARGRSFRVASSTLPSEPIRVLKCGQHTTERYLKLCERYDLLPDLKLIQSMLKWHDTDMSTAGIKAELKKFYGDAAKGTAPVNAFWDTAF